MAFKHFSGAMCKLNSDFLQTWAAEEPHVWSTQELANTLSERPEAPELAHRNSRGFHAENETFGGDHLDLIQDSEKSGVPSAPKPREVTKECGYGFPSTEMSLRAEKLDVTHFTNTPGQGRDCHTSPEAHGRNQQSVSEPERASLSRPKRCRNRAW